MITSSFTPGTVFVLQLVAVSNGPLTPCFQWIVVIGAASSGDGGSLPESYAGSELHYWRTRGRPVHSRAACVCRA